MHRQRSIVHNTNNHMIVYRLTLSTSLLLDCQREMHALLKNKWLSIYVYKKQTPCGCIVQASALDMQYASFIVNWQSESSTETHKRTRKSFSCNRMKPANIQLRISSYCYKHILHIICLVDMVLLKIVCSIKCLFSGLHFSLFSGLVMSKGKPQLET